MIYKFVKCFILVFFICHSSCDENILEKYPPELKNRHLLSCRNHCGKDTGVCSCASRCQLYGNCCEDFTDVCRKEAEDIAALEPLFGTLIKCEYNHFMVASCLSDFNEKRETTPFTPFASQKSNAQAAANQDKLPLNELWWQFHYRPVTNVLNGVNYENERLLSCNSLFPFYKSELWDMEVGVVTGESFPDARHFSGILNHETAWFYLPPSIYSESTRTDFCIPHAINLCPEYYSKIDPWLYQKCQSFVSYIRRFRNGSPVYYKNIYCMQCWKEQWERDYLDFIIITREYNLRATEPIHLAVHIAGALKSQNGFVMAPIQNKIAHEFSWRKTQCIYHKRDFFRCSDFVCKPGMLIADNGMCLYNKTFRLAIGDGGSSLTSNELAKLPAVFSCVIGKTIPNAIDINQQNILQPLEMYDPRLQMGVYVFEINVHWRRSAIRHTNESPMYRVVDIVSKTLWRRHSTRTWHGETKSLPDKVADNLKLKTYDIEKYLPEKSLWYKGKDISDESRKTTSCLCMRENNLEPNCNPFCWQTPYFVGDSENIEEYSSSDCFAMFKSSSIQNQTPALGLLLAFVLLWFLPNSIEL